MAKRNRRKAVLARVNGIALVILLGSALLCLSLHHPDLDLFSPEKFKRAVNQAGLLGPLIYIGLLAVSVVISPLPSAPLAMVAGTIWGPILAGVYSVIGGFLGGVIAYFIGYSLGRSAVKALTGKAIYFSKHRGEAFLSGVIFISRLLPIFSFDLISYGAGIAGLSFPLYAIVTLLGMIPSTFLLTYLGSALTVELPLGIAISIIFLFVLLGFPWAARRYNWFGMREMIRIE